MKTFRFGAWPTTLVFAGLLVTAVLWLRWPGLGFNVWSLDEAIHAAAARVLLEGGVLYRDAIDQRTPLTYYAVAAVFAVFGENNLWAVRLGLAGLIAATAGLLALIATRRHSRGAGLWAGGTYAVLATALLYPGDANAVHTEWFVAFFTSAAAAVLLGAKSPPGRRRWWAAGLLLAAAFLSKQPALLELLAPLAWLAWLFRQTHLSARDAVSRAGALLLGWLGLVGLVAGYFAYHGALGDAVFYAWTYNLTYYGAEISPADRFETLLLLGQLLWPGQGVLLAVWVTGGAVVVHRLLQRQPAAREKTTNGVSLYVGAWTMAALAGSISGGRAFDHYFIQLLPPLALGAGLALGSLTLRAGSPRHRLLARGWAFGVLLAVGGQMAVGAWTARARTLPPDPSLRVSHYIREHSAPADRLFVWGFHPDIYLHADRKPASRFLYGSFLTGLIPWTNIAPDRDTSYAIVPGAMATLLHDLARTQPRFIVDCSAGPNRHWDKYPLEDFPELHEFVQTHYRVVEAGQFVPQGFRLFQRRGPDEPRERAPAGSLPAAQRAELKLGLLGPGLPPIHAYAPHGAAFAMQDGRAEYFAHAPSELTYVLPEKRLRLRGGFGLRPGAYAPDNPAATDGAEFLILWRDPTGHEQVLLRRLLRPVEVEADRGVHSFRLALPGPGPADLVLRITPGPADNPASDWTFWSDLMLEQLPLDEEPDRLIK